MFLSKRKGIYYLFYKDEITGIRKTLSTRTKLKSEAMKFISEFKSSLNTKRNTASYHIIYLEDLKKEVLKYVEFNLEKSTLDIYKRVFKDILRIIGNKPLRSYTIQDFEHYKNTRMSEVKKWTVNIDLRTIRAILNLAVKWNALETNIAKEVKLLAIPQKERLSFNQSELIALLSFVESKNIKDIILFGLYTGCRLNEIINLQIKDVDLEEGILTIRNKPNFKTKTGKIRNIPISESLFDVIKTLNAFQKTNNIINCNNIENFLFANPNGNKYSKDYISHKFKEYVRKANLPEHFHFHCLRHTAITTLIKNGVNINYVKEIAGHSVITTTMNYIHIDTEDLRKGINKISLNCL